MPKRIDYQLTNDEVQLMDEAINHAPEPEVRQRAMALKLLHLGHPAWEVAGIMAVDVVSIYNWHKRWKANGIAGLKNRPRSGRPSNATQTYVEKLEQVIDQDPAQLGYGFTFWTAGRLLRHLEQATGIRLSPNRFRALLKRCGYVYRQPTHDLSALQDPAAHEAAQELLDWLKKTPASIRPSSFSLWTKRP
ncbi:MAG: helix-turn-helix domain-containing protein [Acidobacteria bacterium]|nr:helix-turn-helix domain-containing protein [Acidobacteriota bacterium]